MHLSVDIKNQNVHVPILLLVQQLPLNLAIHNPNMEDSKGLLPMQSLCEEDITNLNLERQALEDPEESLLHRRDHPTLLLLILSHVLLRLLFLMLRYIKKHQHLQIL